MASTIYTPAKAKLSARTVNLTTDTIKAVLVDTGAYTFSAAHEFLSDIPAGARIATSPALGGKSDYYGFFDANDVTFTAVATGTGTGAASEAIVLFKDTGTAGTSSLVAFLDNGTGLPVTSNGGDITVTWPTAGILGLG